MKEINDLLTGVSKIPEDFWNSRRVKLFLNMAFSLGEETIKHKATVLFKECYYDTHPLDPDEFERALDREE